MLHLLREGRQWLREEHKYEGDSYQRSFADAVHRLEPELPHLAGILTTLRIFGEAGDSIEPVVLAALARLMEGSVDELTICWRQLFEAIAK